MLIIRNDQLALLAADRLRQFVETMCLHLREQFPQALAGTSEPALHDQVRLALAQARGYGLQGARDCCRYLNLCVTYGWDFDQREENAWMRRYLTDAGISVPGRRLERLVAECMHREAVAASNRRQRHAFLQLTSPGEHHAGNI